MAWAVPGEKSMVEVGLVALKRLGFSVRYIDLEGKDVIRLPASPSSSEVQTVVMFRALPQSFQIRLSRRLPYYYIII